MRRTAQGVGYTRRRLAKLLMAEFAEQCGFDAEFQPDRLNPAQGWERSSGAADTFRWSGFGKVRVGDGWISCAVDSYSTMTECVRNGVLIERDRAMTFDVTAKPDRIRKDAY